MATTTVAPPSGTGTSRSGTARPAFLLLMTVAAVVALAVALGASVMFGSRSTSFGEVLDVLGGSADANVTAIVESRYPRTVLGVLAGLCLAVAGTLMQGVSRNPLAEPGLLGINAGASASTVAATAWLGASGTTDTMLWALPGALIAGVLVHVIGSAGTGTSVVRLVLAGAVLTAVLMAFIQAVTLSKPQVFDSYRYWVVGALGGRDFDVFWSVLPFAAVGLLLALALGPGLNALALGTRPPSPSAPTRPAPGAAGCSPPPCSAPPRPPPSARSPSSASPFPTWYGPWSASTSGSSSSSPRCSARPCCSSRT